jgi:hypothetical protein
MMMQNYDKAEYVGPDPAYAGQKADIRPLNKAKSELSGDSPIEVRWEDPNLPKNDDLGYSPVRDDWHYHMAKNFKILVRVPAA